ncbi:MAG: hypothetical protein JWO74_3478, partial [Solirubrobacterales bacterium]|nr:hypothetical protein [Solirubrobacterales bacterium]
MKKHLVPAVLVAAAVAIPGSALAKGKPEAPGQTKPHGQSGQAHGNSHKCKAHSVGYIVAGTLTSYDLKQTAGAQTPADKSDDRYSGTLGLTVTKTNHHANAVSGPQPVTDVRVSFGDGVAQPPATGSRVKLIGKVTKVGKKCTDQSAAGQVTYRKVTFT